jgi:thiamine pyrophosphokinase
MPEEDDLVIAADWGYENAKALGVVPSVAVGDFDSSAEPTDKGVEIIRLKREKDATDTQVALELALQRGADEIVIIGGLDGRLDHTAANLAMLEYLYKRNIRRAYIEDGYNRARFIKNDSALLLRDKYKYFSVVAVDEKLVGVEIKGAKYPLKNAKIFRHNQFAVSNEIDGNCAFIAIKRGAAYIIESGIE